MSEDRFSYLLILTVLLALSLLRWQMVKYLRLPSKNSFWVSLGTTDLIILVCIGLIWGIQMAIDVMAMLVIANLFPAIEHLIFIYKQDKNNHIINNAIKELDRQNG